MKIEVKSTDENFEKEKSGIKPCTIRELDGKDVIKITNKSTGEVIERKITDISIWDEHLIISFDKVKKRG